MRRTRQTIKKGVPIDVEPEEENEAHRALLNDVVLQNILKYLDYQDLKSCREVGNKTWLQNSKKAWWSRTKIVFKYDLILEDKLTDYLNQTAITSNAINYKFEFVDESLTRFWQSLGDSIKDLEIEDGRFPSVDDFRRIIYTQCPNLEKLAFGTVVTEVRNDYLEPRKWENPQFGQQSKLKYFESQEDPLPVSWMEFLSHFPNLQNLKVHANSDDIYKTISIIRQHDPKMLKLNQIKIYGLNGHYDESIRRVHLDRKLSFENIRIDYDNCQPETLEDILELHANSLKELYVKNWHSSNTKPLSLRKPLQHLEKLIIKNCVFTEDIFKCIPNVRKVHLDYKLSLHNLSPEVGSSLSINSCKELTLRIHRRYCDEPKLDLTFFMNVFPNVEILEVIDINNSQFLSICERWTKLMHFDCNLYSQVDATGLLGYDPDSEDSNEIRRPNITNLRDLQSFSMKGRDGLEMKNGDAILKELEELQNLKKFELTRYKCEGEIWKRIFTKYSRE